MFRVVLVLAALSAAVMWAVPPRAEGPCYSPEGELLLPAGVERWVAVGSSVGLGYSEVEAGNSIEMFHTVLMEPAAYAAYRGAERFPDGTMLALVVREPAARAAPARGGRVAGRLAGVELAVKDTARFAGGWAYFGFGRSRPGTPARPFPRERCAACHARHAARDNVFVQFYPLLRE